MIYMRFEFDEDKLYEDDRNLKGAFSWLDRIATKCKLDKYKVDNGYFETKNDEELQAFINMFMVLLFNKNINKYCGKWDFFSEDDGLEDCLKHSLIGKKYEN